MSVYRDTDTSEATHPTLEHPFPGPLTARVYRDGVLLKVESGIEPVGKRFRVPLTFRETEFDGPLTIEWSGDDGGKAFLRRTTEQVVTPLVPISRLQTVFEDTNWSPAKLQELENTIRIFIQSYTGQEFGYQSGTRVVTGTGEKRAALPQRLIRLTNVAGGPPGFFTVSNDGWYIYMSNKNWLTTKEVPPEEYYNASPTYMTKGVIHVPDSYWKQFRVGAKYEITGEWGYYTVPEDIQEAALLLANDWGCDDAIYRDRYLEVVKYSDSNMAFNAAAWRGTGNARADQLLGSYRRDGMVII